MRKVVLILSAALSLAGCESGDDRYAGERCLPLAGAENIVICSGGRKVSSPSTASDDALALMMIGAVNGYNQGRARSSLHTMSCTGSAGSSIVNCLDF